MTRNQRINLYFKSLNKSQKEITADLKVVGISKQTVSNILKGSNEPSDETLEKICQKYLTLNYRWATTGQGNMTLSENEIIKPDSPSRYLGSIERELYEKMIKDKDEFILTLKEEISFLRQLRSPKEKEPTSPFREEPQVKPGNFHEAPPMEEGPSPDINYTKPKKTHK